MDLTFHNLSTHQLTSEDYQLLNKGLSFSPTPNTPQKEIQQQILRNFDQFASSLRLKYMRIMHTSQKPHQEQLKPTTTSYIYRAMKFLPKPNTETPLRRYTGVAQLENYIENTKQRIADHLPLLTKSNSPNLSSTQHQALKNLQRLRHTVTIKPADKNLGIVLMNTDEYIMGCMKHLTDTNTYRLATKYPMQDIQRELQQTIGNFKPQLLTYNKQLYLHLSNGLKQPRIPQFYGIPKIHKEYTHFPPLRPIVSQSSSVLSPSAQFLDHILQPIARTYPDYLHNSTSLSLILQDLSVPDDAILVSVDVESLYPSIPQSECLDLIYREMHNHSHLLPFDPNLIIRLLHINMNYNYFHFAHLCFQQVQGTAMGAVFSPTVANIFMSCVIRDFLRTQKNKPLVLTRYIDDIFLLWTGNLDELNTFLTELNSFHSSLRFTYKYSPLSIDFLDLTIFKGRNFHLTNILDTKTFQKPRNLYQYLHFTSEHPISTFKSIIKGECVVSRSLRLVPLQS